MAKETNTAPESTPEETPAAPAFYRVLASCIGVGPHVLMAGDLVPAERFPDPTELLEAGFIEEAE